MTSDQLFTSDVTHIELRCWQCKHVATLTRDQLPPGITDAELTARAKCKCGTGWPEVVAFPRPSKRF